MARYEKEFKEQTVKKMMSPNAASVARLSRETGVCEATLYNWRNEYRRQGVTGSGTRAGSVL
jgi:transposase-like protein